MPARLIGHAAGDIDLAVLSVDRPLSPPDLPLEPAMKGMIFGQDAFFLGFPYNDLSRYAFGRDGFPLPFVKKAILSCFDGGLMYLDGHNNPGFSGGPVVYVPAGERDFRVAGVVSGYRFEAKPVMSGPLATGLVHHENTGIVIAHSVDHAVDLIRANPIGCRL